MKIDNMNCNTDIEKSNVFVLLGPPGSGKGSFSSLCINNFGWEQLSTGNLCRKHIADKTEIGKHIDFIIKSGKLVGDDVIIEMVKGWIFEQLESGKSILLDGYPRNIAQAKALGLLLEQEFFKGVRFFVVDFVVSDDTVIQRLTTRLVCKNKSCQAVYSAVKGSGLEPKIEFVCDKCSGELEIRVDDNVETIKERLKIYHENADGLLNFYKENKKDIIELDASLPIESVFSSFKKALC